MNKDKLIEQCWYYKGEKNNPFDWEQQNNQNVFWDYESTFCDSYLNGAYGQIEPKQAYTQFFDKLIIHIADKFEISIESVRTRYYKGVLLDCCHYYRGEEENPFGAFPYDWFWDMERVYVKNEGKFTGECEIYEAHHFRDFDMPYCLLMVMFTSWAKTTHDLEKEIPEFYKLIEQYLNNRKD